MKKLFLTFLATVGFGLLPLTANAAGKTDITGTVTNNGSPVKGATVTVACNGHTKKDKTDAAGGYLVQFTTTECPSGSSVTATAVTKGKKGLSGSNSGTVSSLSDRLDIAVVNIALPELGLLTGFGAAILGTGAFLAVRRRDLNGSTH